MQIYDNHLVQILRGPMQSHCSHQTLLSFQHSAHPAYRNFTIHWLGIPITDFTFHGNNMTLQSTDPHPSTVDVMRSWRKAVMPRIEKLFIGWLLQASSREADLQCLDLLIYWGGSIALQWVILIFPKHGNIPAAHAHPDLYRYEATAFTPRNKKLVSCVQGESRAEYEEIYAMIRNASLTTQIGALPFWWGCRDSMKGQAMLHARHCMR